MEKKKSKIVYSGKSLDDLTCVTLRKEGNIYFHTAIPSKFAKINTEYIILNAGIDGDFLGAWSISHIGGLDGSNTRAWFSEIKEVSSSEEG